MVSPRTKSSRAQPGKQKLNRSMSNPFYSPMIRRELAGPQPTPILQKENLNESDVLFESAKFSK
jgi:hypothetical protein